MAIAIASRLGKLQAWRARCTTGEPRGDPMSQPTNSLKDGIDKTEQQLATLMDEVRVKLHLGGLDAKDKFAEIEHRVHQMMRNVESASRSTMAELIRDLKTLEAKLGLTP
jgi:ElaB/YqjD/DUF883 family membrane-anchored ribosome-binding protein